MFFVSICTSFCANKNDVQAKIPVVLSLANMHNCVIEKNGGKKMRRNLKHTEDTPQQIAKTVHGLTLPASAGMFMEFVANPIPNAIADSTPRNLATSFSSSSCLSRLPEVNKYTQESHIEYLRNPDCLDYLRSHSFAFLLGVICIDGRHSLISPLNMKLQVRQVTSSQLDFKYLKK